MVPGWSMWQIETWAGWWMLRMDTVSIGSDRSYLWVAWGGRLKLTAQIGPRGLLYRSFFDDLDTDTAAGVPSPIYEMRDDCVSQGSGHACWASIFARERQASLASS